jgi:hydroxymethylpyrimidine/phosphomethylpyrimidine kinase
MDDTLPPSLPCALTIAGSDSSGGAGIQGDLRTFAALRVFGTSAVTAITAQNTQQVRESHVLTPALVRAQVEAVLVDMPVLAAKTGMLGNAAVVEAVAVSLEGRGLPLVIDPVITSKSGAMLVDDEGVRAMVRKLFPLCSLLTPNVPEAERLVGFPVRSVEDQERAGRALVDMGVRAALVKGGHAAGAGGAKTLVDVLVEAGGRVTCLETPRLQTRHTHGTGCALSAAVAALVARHRHGSRLAWDFSAVAREAQAYVARAIAQAPGLGQGHGPIHHMHPCYGRDGGDGPQR